jgi:hypothetical protein
MSEEAKAFDEMTRQERADLMSVVTLALEEFAEEAADGGDAMAACNFRCVAGSLIGCAVEEPSHLNATALLMEQAIALMHAFRTRKEKPGFHH